MSLFQQAQERKIQAIKSKDTAAASSLRMLIAKLQTLGDETDETLISTVKSLIKQNNEEIESRSGHIKMPDGTIKEVVLENQEDELARLNAENKVLESFLPKYLSADEIKILLTTEDKLMQIKSAKTIGAAIGISMKVLKGLDIEGSTVKSVVAELYESKS